MKRGVKPNLSSTPIFESFDNVIYLPHVQEADRLPEDGNGFYPLLYTTTRDLRVVWPGSGMSCAPQYLDRR